MTQPRRWLGEALPLLAIWVPVLINIVHVVGFTLYTVWVSFTASTLLPNNDWVGLRNYSAVLATRNWQIAAGNMVVYGVCFLVLTTALGLLLAVLIDQKLRGENIVRTIFLYPLAVSFVVTGVVWGWLLNPGIGIQKLVVGLGWTGFRFDWLVDRNRALYCIVLAGAWQASGFAMALFLAGLRSVDADLMKAAQIDGAGLLRTYLHCCVCDFVAVRHQDLRPCHGVNRRRTRHRDRPAVDGCLRLHVSAWLAGTRVRRCGAAAYDAAGCVAPIRGVSPVATAERR
jgi:ABC-type sugar transport system permease subunit